MLNPNDLRRYRETIAKSVVFEQLESGDVDLILSSCRLLDTAAGGFILTEGLPSDGLYIILEGQIEFLLPEHAGGGLRRPSRIRLNVLGPGRCFGEYGVNISEGTVKLHLHKIYEKLHVDGRLALTLYAQGKGLV